MLEFEEYKAKLNNARPALEVLRGALKLEAAQKEIEELEAASEREGFWNDVEKSQKVQKRLKNLKDKVENYNSILLLNFIFLLAFNITILMIYLCPCMLSCSVLSSSL